MSGGVDSNHEKNKEIAQKMVNAIDAKNGPLIDDKRDKGTQKKRNKGKKGSQKKASKKGSKKTPLKYVPHQNVDNSKKSNIDAEDYIE